MIDVERAGDFLVMAATLMEIKSRMLLPREEMIADEAADPRQELVRQLLEYKKFKDAALLLEAQAERQLTRFSRLRVDPPVTIDPAHQPLHAVELWDLVSAFGRLMRETLALQPQQIVVDETPVQIYQDRILKMLENQPRLAFAQVFTPPRTRSLLVGLFLAILELIRTNQIFAHQEEGFGDIWIGPMATELPPPGETASPPPTLA
jgi:segregation and condensation protein A